MSNLVKCDCNLRTRLVGDGCHICNPALALEYLRETVEEQADRIAELEAALAESISMAAKICDGRDALEAALAEAQKERDRALEDAGAARLAFDDWRVAHSTVQLEAENERLKHQLAEAQKDAASLREFAQWVASLRTGGMIERKAKEALEGER